MGIKIATNKKIRYKNYFGVYYIESKIRKFQSKPDRCFYITYKKHGKKIWEKVGWKSEGYASSTANALRGKRLQQLRNHEEFSHKATKENTLGDVWKKYDKWLDSNKKRPRDDRYNYRKHLKKKYANKFLSDITPIELEKLKTKLQNSGLKPATVKHILVLIRQLFNKAKSWGMWIGDNPVSKIKLPPINNRRRRFFSRNQAAALLSELKKIDLQLHDMALLSLNTGIRLGEVCSLQWGDLDLDNRRIHIIDTKNGEDRDAFANDQVIEMLNRIASGERNELIFKNSKDQKIRWLSKDFKATIDKLGFNDGLESKSLDRLSFHSLRHTFLSWLAQKGTPLQVIQELAGHKDISMTLRYSHLLPDNKIDAVMGLHDIE